MHIYDPTVPVPERNHARAPALGTLEGKTIGVLENGKLNAANILGETAALFEARHRCKIMPDLLEDQCECSGATGNARPDHERGRPPDNRDR